MVDCPRCGGRIVEDWDDEHGYIGTCSICELTFQINLEEIDCTEK